MVMLRGFLGNLAEPLLNTASLMLGRKSVTGSSIGGITETQELIDFWNKQGTTSDIEVIKIQDINEVYKRIA
jgi:alcohol dehydrogenase (NADP+)